MSIVSNAGKIVQVFARAIDARRQRTDWAHYEESHEPVPRDRFAAAIYFADEPLNMYQIQQWYAPMVELSKSQPVAVIARDIRTANILRRECPLPVVWLPYIADIEKWVSSQGIGAVFYLNQNTLNFSMLRFREPAHVFLSHGESDKDYMASNQLKAYDYTFIAGAAARDRIASRLVDYDVEKRAITIGRPQVDVDYPGPGLPTDDRTVVLYAPTWEGDRPSMAYSSILTHGKAMLEALAATGRHRVIYRPHPRTGLSDPAYASADKALKWILKSANDADPTARHMVDTDTPFGWHLLAADECIADISAVAFDWLATGKPMVLTTPSNPNADMADGGIASRVATLSSAKSVEIVSALERQHEPARREARLAIVERYFGDSRPGAAMQRFVDAATSVIERRSGAHASDAAPGPRS